jgi:5S rRNA maturation endonuclease (ribonuclease M5)
LSTTKKTDIQGMKQLPKKGKLLIITSSMKDLLVLKLFSYNAIALGGEGNDIPDKILDYLYACFDEIIIFYDNDKPGLMYGEIMAKRLGTRFIYIPVEFKEKDISDFREVHGEDKTRDLLKKLI